MVSNKQIRRLWNYPHAVYLQRKGTCNPFPGTNRMRFAWLEIFAENGFRRKIMIAFHYNCLFAFGDDDIVPYRFPV